MATDETKATCKQSLQVRPDDLPRVTLQSTHGGTYYWVIRHRDGSVFASLDKSPKQQCDAIAKALAEATFAGRMQRKEAELAEDEQRARWSAMYDGDL